MKKAITTLIQPRGWMSIIGRSVFLVLFVMGIQSGLTAQIDMDLDNDITCGDDAPTFTSEGVYTDGSGLYDDNLNDRGITFWTFCPSAGNRVEIIFSEFDINGDDEFKIHGTCAVAGGEEIEGNSVGGMNTSSPDDTGVDFGAGWARASCENTTGCLTVSFNTDDVSTNDTKGAGWTFEVKHVAIPITVKCPSPLYTNADNVLANCGTPEVFIFNMPTLEDCATASIYSVEYQLNGIAAAINQTTRATMQPLAAGVYTLKYVLKLGDAVIDMQECEFTVKTPEKLVCNDNLSVSLGQDCWAELTPDMLIENGEDATNNGNIEISIDGGASYAATQNVKEGPHTFRVKDGCGNVCGGTITVVDYQAPVCPGPSASTLICGDALPAAVSPDFIECGTETASHSDATVGDGCTDISQAELQAIADALGVNAAVVPGLFAAANPIPKTTGGGVVLTGSGASLPAADYFLTADPGDGTGIFVDVSAGGAIVIRGTNGAEIVIPAGASLTGASIRNWKATDNNGNTVESCPQVFGRVRPNVPLAADLGLAPVIEVSCNTTTTPAGLSAAKILNTTTDVSGYAPNFTLTINGSPSTKYILEDDHEACGFATKYEDTVLESCGGGMKIARTWTLIDWCNVTNPPTTATQIIKITDDAEPTLDAVLSDVTIGTSDHECTADIVVASASFSDGCSDVVSHRTDLVEYANHNGTADGTIDGNDIAAAPADKVWSVNGNGGTFTNIAPGQYWGVTYATDECGNETSTHVTSSSATRNISYYIITVVDDERPQPQCDDEIIVSLGGDWGRIYAADVDEGSRDNCGIVSLAVSTDDGVTDDYGDYVDISCDSIHADLKVYLRATDAATNSNICWSKITIEDKIAPTCTPPADMTVNCDTLHFADLLTTSGDITGTPLMGHLNAMFGTPTCTDNIGCGTLTMAQSLAFTGGNCGVDTLTRTFTATDWGPRTSAPVTQTIIVEYNPNWKVTLPADATIGCGDEFPAAADAASILTSVGFCDRLSVNVEGQLFTGESDACVKMVRTYTIWNSCGDAGTVYNVNADDNGDLMVTNSETSAERIVYVQTITAEVTQGPVTSLTLPDAEITAGPNKAGAGDCSEVKEFQFWAADCLGNDIDGSGLTLVIKDAAGNEVTPVSSEYDVANAELLVSINAGPGTYTVEGWATDGCGNSTGETASVTFVDYKAPSIYVLNGIATHVMPTSKSIDIWASDFIEDIVDCDDDLTIALWHNSDGAAPDCNDRAALEELGQSVEFGCIHLGTQLVRIYAMDSAGNCDFVETYMIIQDNGGGCGSDPGGAIPTSSQVAGKVINTSGDLVEAVNVAVNGAMSDAMTTAATGTFGFTLDNGGDYTITPEKDVNPLNGVSTFDLVLISKHILGVDQFDTPYQYIAADVNKNGSVTAFDIVQLRQLILNITPDFTNNTSWRFVDASYNFGSDVSTTLTQNFPELMNINNLIDDKLDNDFIGVKIGDINGSATPNSLVSAEVRNASGTLVLSTADRYVEAGETLEVAFAAAEIASVTGYQFTMNYAGLELAELVEGTAKADNFNANLRGAIATSWNGTATADEALFTVNFTATTSGALSELLSVNSDITTAEAYSTSGEVLDVALEFTGIAQTAFELNQNTPNPFTGETVIGFTLPQAGQATLKVMDIQGKVLKQIEGDYAKGFNQISLNAKELGATGILHYQLESAEHTATRKMIIIE